MALNAFLPIVNPPNEVYFRFRSHFPISAPPLRRLSSSATPRPQTWLSISAPPQFLKITRCKSNDDEYEVAFGVLRGKSDSLNEAFGILLICPNPDLDADTLCSIVAETIGGDYEKTCIAVNAALDVARRKGVPSALVGRKFKLCDVENFKNDLEFVVDVLVDLDKSSDANVLIYPNESKDPVRVAKTIAKVIGGDLEKTEKCAKRAIYLARNKNGPSVLNIKRTFTVSQITKYKQLLDANEEFQVSIDVMIKK
ncbi:hypothetical protein V6N13_122301 [Hibiscus sabdariffa]|uniref:Uncharacterized protein n=1 Tax=Hibiscus sabdariffa TaxID=183260 RepID=A0ABR2NKD7_9ROSI